MIVRTVLKSIKPFSLVSLFTTYILGAGLVQYLRKFLGLGDLLLGGLFLLFVVIGFELMGVNQDLRDARNWPSNSSPVEVRRARWIIALIVTTLLTVSVTIFIDWMVRDVLWQGLVFLVVGFVITCALYFISENNEILKPYKILIESFLFVVIPPAFAFFLQSSEPHRLLTLVVVGLIPTFLAYRIMVQLKSYNDDLTSGTNTFVSHIGWEKAMVAHNALILLSYLLFAMDAIIGFPWFLLWPVFLTLPIGLVEIWLMERVRHGSKPLWRLMQFATASVFFIPMYLLGFAFWIR